MLYKEDWMLAQTTVDFQKFVWAASPSTEAEHKLQDLCSAWQGKTRAEHSP